MTYQNTKRNYQAVTNSSKISNIFNEYFAEIDLKLADKIDTPATSYLFVNPLTTRLKSSFFLNP